jgi:uncharacterized membrane-anchored protein
MTPQTDGVKDTLTKTSSRIMLNKVAEVTIWFWIIKVLCTTVGESFADWINMTLGVGLQKTALIFTGVLIAVLAWQFAVRRYVPFAYWLTVVVVSVTGTLYTDILTDAHGVPLALSTSVFAVLLAIVFGVWYARERTLSIHTIVTTPREAFYWLAVLVTFALGTAAGDWTLELTGWSPGVAVLLPAGLIAAIWLGWRLGMNAVLSFWIAYILTRPLGANLGDYFASSKADGGLGLGTALTSVIFLGAILATVIYLTISKSDVTERQGHHEPKVKTTPARERLMLGYLAVVVIAAGSLLAWGHSQPHTQPAAEGDSQPAATVQLSPVQATASFPTADVTAFRVIVTDTSAKLQSGNQVAATTRVKDLETAWDDAQDRLQPLNGTGWTYLDGQIDTVLNALRASHPDVPTEQTALNALLASLAA